MSLKDELRKLRTRVANSIARAVIKNVDNSTKMQMLQLGEIEGGPYDDCENFQGFGLCGVPLPGAEVVVVFPNGDRAHALVVGVEDRRYRPTDWESGEAGIYNAFDAIVRLRDDGTIDAGSAAGIKAELAYKAALDSLKSIFNAWIVAPNDGGAALKTALSSWTPTGTTKLKAE